MPIAPASAGTSPAPGRSRPLRPRRNRRLILCVAAIGFLILGSVPAGAASDDWDQVGEDLYGRWEGDRFGHDVAASAEGDSIVVATRSILGGLEMRAKVYDWNGTAWVQRGSEIDGGTIDGQAWSGSNGTVAMSADGQTIAVGNPSEDANGPDAGHVRIFDWSGSAWVQRGVDVDGPSAGSLFGSSVALADDGDTFVAGAPRARIDGIERGQVRVFDWNGSAWTQRGGPVDGTSQWGVTGSAVAVDAAGDTFATATKSGAGFTEVFDWNGSAWTQRGSDIPGEAPGDLGGGGDVSLSNNGDTVAVGAPLNDGNGDQSGHVRIYEWQGSRWTQRGADIDGEAADDYSGGSVALSADGSTVAIGARGNDAGWPAHYPGGHVRVLDWNGSAWTQRGGDIDGLASAGSGQVELSDDGARAVIGGQFYGIGTGVVQVHEACLPSATSSVSGDRPGRNGTVHARSFDRNLGTYFESSHVNWQHVTIDLGCPHEFGGIRRYLSRRGNVAGGRGFQGETVYHSLDGRNWTQLTGPTTTGWGRYTNYNNGEAWHSLNFGWSNWLRPTEPVRARYIRYSWDGHSIGERLHEIDLDPCPATGPGCGPLSVVVPNVAGNTQSTAVGTLANAGLVASINRQSSISVPAGRVINTWPAPGAAVSDGSTVSVRISTGPPAPRVVTVPNVTGEPLSIARSTLINAGLRVSVREAGRGDPGMVTAQSPRGGRQVNEGSTVTLTIPSPGFPPR